MIIIPPKQEDELKKLIENASKDIKNNQLSPHTKGEHKEWLEKIQVSIPEIEKEINEIISSLKADILKCNAREILECFSFRYALSTNETMEEDLDKNRQFKLDYILSLVGAIGILKDEQAESIVLENISNNLDKLEMKSMIYLMFITNNVNGEPNEIKFKQALHNMVVRGDSFSIHKIFMCKELFSKYDDIFIKNYDITANELIDKLINIAETPTQNANTIEQAHKFMQSAHQDFVKKMEEIDDIQEQYKFLIEYKNSNTAQQARQKLDNLYENSAVIFGDSVFKFKESDLPNEIIKLLSIELQENIQFQQGKIEYFPTNHTAIYDKPFLKIGDDYHCFNPASIYYNLQNILENILLNIIPPNKHQKQYYKRKGDYLEENSLQLFGKMLPNCEIYENLKYGVDDEVDGLVIYDNNILIIESKSNKFTDGAKKGNLDKIKRNTKDIIEKSYQQAIRAKKYILSDKSVEFRDKNKRTVLTIDNTQQKNIYLINTTLEPLNHITANLTSLKEFGFIQDDEWIWSVYLNDLRIIAEIIESPSEFLLYLERRIKFNDYPQIRMAEEIDIFGYFLQQGLYFDDLDIPENGFMLSIDSSYSKDIDNYYYWKEGTIKEKQMKPKFNAWFKENFLSLVKSIENSNKEGFSELSKLMLGFDGYTQDMVEKQIQLMRNGKRTDFHLRFEKENVGVLFITKRVYVKKDIKKQCQLYAHETKINHWYAIIVDKTKVDFEYFYFENKKNIYLDLEVKELQKFRLNQTLEARKKIGRNEPCPCGSGKKYKKCCL